MSAIVAANSSDANAVASLPRNAATDAGTLADKASRRTAPPAIDANQADAGRGPAWLLTLSPRTNVSLPQASLDALRPILSDDLAKSLTEQLQKTNDALTTLDQTRKSIAGDRKADAQQKLEQARKKLEMLRMLGGDPKTIAKQAKAIAQEIKAAASEYTSALQSEGGGGATAAAAAAAVDSTSPATDASPAKNIPADAVDAVPATGVTAAPPDRSGDRIGDISTAASAGPAGTSASSQAAAKLADPEATRQKSVQAYQDAADGAAAKAGRDRDEQDVLAKFKDAAREARQIIEDAARRLRARHPSDPDASAATQAEVAMDKAIQDLSDAMQNEQGSGSVDISIGIDTTAIAMPALNIQA